MKHVKQANLNIMVRESFNIIIVRRGQ